jgi:hypothetical protein
MDAFELGGCIHAYLFVYALAVLEGPSSSHVCIMPITFAAKVLHYLGNTVAGTLVTA